MIMSGMRQKQVRPGGFTLIELLAVIAIIAIIAGMVAGLAPAVNAKKKTQRVAAEKDKLVTLIENYKAKFGHYPPDNPALAVGGLPPEAYDTYSQINSLLYELTGGTNNAGGTAQQSGANYYTVWGTNFPESDIRSAYGVAGILNADAQQEVVYRPLPQASAAMPYPAWKVMTQITVGSMALNWPPSGNPPATHLEGLVVPVDMVQVDDPGNKNATSPATMPRATTTNFWHYDASSTNRHNIDSFDLWAEFVTGRKGGGWVYVTNGNW